MSAADTDNRRVAVLETALRVISGMKHADFGASNDAEMVFGMAHLAGAALGLHEPRGTAVGVLALAAAQQPLGEEQT